MALKSGGVNNWCLPWRDFDKIESIMRLKDEFQPKEPLSELCVYLQSTTDAECSDPRDRLFALLGMLVRPLFHADYGQSLQMLYTEFSRSMIEIGYVHELCTVAAHLFMANATRIDSGSDMPSRCIVFSKASLVRR